MSDQVNDQLLERANEVMDYFEGTAIQTAILNNYSINDLEMVEHIVTEAEAEIARQEFHNADAL